MGTLKLNKKEENKSVISAESNLESVTKPINKTEKQDMAEVSTENVELCALAKQDEGFVEELKDLRTANQTVYRRNDRTCRKVITAAPTRYFGSDGEYKEISNRLTDNGAEIVNEANSFKVKFNKDEHSDKIFELQKGSNKVKLSAAGSKKARGHVCGCKCRLCEGKDNTVTATLDDGTEIEYVTMNDRVKENIIVKERQESYEYNFVLNIGGLKVEEGEHNDLLLKDKETGETEFRIPAPYMYDANGKRSDKVSYEIDVNGDELEIKVIADAEFINAEGRAFPVIIDPQIVAFYGDLLTYYTEGYADHNAENDIYPGEMFINAIKSGTASDSVYITVQKSNINIDGTVEKVLLYVDAEAGAQGYMLVLNKIYLLEEKEYVFDITEYYLSANSDFDVTMIGDTSRYGNERSNAIFSSAKLVINYVSNEPVYSDNNTPAVKQIPLNKKAALNLYLIDGTASAEVDDGISENMPFLNVRHIYKASDENFGCGKNMILNLHRKLNAVTNEETVTKFIYTDESGDKYCLSEMYYFKDAALNPVCVSKADVLIDIDGTLMYDGKPVYVKQTACGYTLIPETSGFLNSDTIESRHNEQLQLEEAVKSYERSLINLIVVESAEANSCDVVKKLKGLSEADFISFIDKVESSSTLIAMEESNLNQFKQICLQVEDYKEKQGAAYKELSKDYSDENYKNYRKAVKFFEAAEEQLNTFIKQCKQNLEYIKDCFKNYLIKKRELTQLTKQTPVNYLKDENGEISGFNRDGDLVLICDSYGNYVNILYNEENRITQIYGNNDSVMQFKYANGLLQSITDHLGRQVTYTYDKDGQLKTLTYPDGEALTFEYQSNGLRSIITSNGMQAKLSTDEFNRIKTISENTLPVTISETAEYPKYEFNKNLSTVKIEYGTETDGAAFTKLTGKENEYEKYVFADDGRIKTSETCDNSFVKTVKTYTYDQSGNVTKSVTVSDLKQTEEETFTYDGLDRVIKCESGWQNVSDTVKTKTIKTYGYDLDGNLIKETTTVQTDVCGNVTPKKSVVVYSYNAQGSLTLTESYIEDEKHTSGINYEQRVYNDSGNMVKCIRWNSLDSTSKFYTESDRAENGQITADRDETGEVSAEYEYVNGTSVVNSVKYPNGSKFAYGRNPNNFEVTGITHSTDDGEANVTDLTYNYGLPVKVKSGNTTIGYTYDHTRRKTSVTVNGVTQATYTYKDYTYNTNQNKCTFGEQTTVLNDGKGTVTTIQESKTGVLDTVSGRIKATEIIKIDGSEKYRKEYDQNGRLTSVKNDGVPTTFTYDNYDNVTSITGGGLSENYRYNDYGEVTQKVITIGEETQTYSYTYKDNAARSLESISVADYTFKPLTDVNGRNTGREVYRGENNILSEYITYRKVGDHATNMPATVWFGNGEKIAESIKYKYDSCGNICQITENGHVIAKYTYDSLNRLIREDNKPLNKTVLFSYDQNGNITERCEYAYTLKSGEELTALNCTHNNYDYEGDKLVNYNGKEFEYNNLGCPTTYRGNTATWQYGKYLASYKGVTFTYNGNGSRASKGGITFTYDSDGRLIKQSDGLEFIYDNVGIAGFKYGLAEFFYRKDAQGNIVAIIDADGGVVAKYEYDAWGNHNVTDKDGNKITFSYSIGNINPFRYRGYYYDTETGLYYLHTRYYDPEVGRFISQDSIDYADPETINGLNLYAYCGNNPVMNVDPTGTFWGIFFAIVAILLFTPIGGVVAQPVVSATSYIGMSIGAIFDEDIRADMNAIGWNLFNTNENAVLNSSKVSFYKGVPVYRSNSNRSGTYYVITLDKYANITDLKHERGHAWQSMMMGIGTYGLMIGLPSMLEWSNREYYNRPWEITADILGGVTSRKHSKEDISRGWWYFAVSNIFGPFGYFFLIGENK